MSKKIAFIMDPPGKLKLETDSSIFLMKEGQNLGYDICYLPAEELFAENGIAYGYSYTPLFKNDLKLSKKEKIQLEEFDVIILRKDPPFNMDYIYITYIVELVENKVLCINKPSTVRSVNEKFYSQHFPDLIPNTIISKNPKEIQRFLEKYEKGVIKPLDLMGGKGVELITDVLKEYKKIEQATKNGSKYIVAQEYLKGIETSGDKRITLLNGKPINALLRIPKEGDFRGNISVGATAVKCDISQKELEICSKLESWLKKEGLHFVGLDFIDEKLTEINVTSPILGQALYPENADLIYDFIEEAL